MLLKLSTHAARNLYRLPRWTAPPHGKHLVHPSRATPAGIYPPTVVHATFSSRYAFVVGNPSPRIYIYRGANAVRCCPCEPPCVPILLGSLEVAGHSLLHKRRSGCTREVQGEKREVKFEVILRAGEKQGHYIIRTVVQNQGHLLTVRNEHERQLEVWQENQKFGSHFAQVTNSVDRTRPFSNKKSGLGRFFQTRNLVWTGFPVSN